MCVLGQFTVTLKNFKSQIQTIKIVQLDIHDNSNIDTNVGSEELALNELPASQHETVWDNGVGLPFVFSVLHTDTKVLYFYVRFADAWEVTRATTIFC